MRLAVIPARGGSKRIPRKNIKDFQGQPLISYSIQAAVEANCFDEIIVSTDDAEIRDIAEKYGANVPFIRPAEISDDYATTLDVIQHAIQFYAEQGIKITEVCCIYATAPFIQAKFIQEGLELLLSSQSDYTFSITSFPFPVQRALTISETSQTSMLHPEHMNTRSQDLVETYHDAGQFYWGTAAAFSQKKPIFLSQSLGVILPRNQVQDIDTLEDWLVAESMYKALNQ